MNEFILNLWTLFCYYMYLCMYIFVQNETIKREDAESYANTLETFRNELNDRIEYLEGRLAEMTEERKTEQEKLIHTITEEMTRSKVFTTSESVPPASSETTSVDLPSVNGGTNDGNDSDINESDYPRSDLFVSTTMPQMTR